MYYPAQCKPPFHQLILLDDDLWTSTSPQTDLFQTRDLPQNVENKQQCTILFVQLTL